MSNWERQRKALEEANSKTLAWHGQDLSRAMLHLRDSEQVRR